MNKYGLDARFSALAGEYEGMTVGRVLSQERGRYRVVSEFGEQAAIVSGKFEYHAKTVSDFPAVGDFVMFEPNADGDFVVIQAVLARKSVFVRKSAGTGRQEQVVAANIDTVFICMSLNNDFNIRRLERYLAAVYDSGATPVIVFTKADLCDDVNGIIDTLPFEITLGADVLVTSSFAEGGHEAILPYLQSGKTVAFVGSSGVGKSTLINRLVGNDRIATQGLRNDDKGRHTTTHRELIMLETGAMVIDTPGMRELGMWDNTIGIDTVFQEIEQLAMACKFKNCTHTNEPGCAVRAAIQTGELTEERLDAYLKLKQENEYMADSKAYLAAKEEKFKNISKLNKQHKKKS